jgi:hypothetical protein
MSARHDGAAAIITNQFRGRRGMVYELKCTHAKLTLCMSARETPADADEWKVEATTRPVVGGPDVLIAEWGRTRVDALRELGRSWGAKAASRELPPVDWEAIATALDAVRALHDPRGRA